MERLIKEAEKLLSNILMFSCTYPIVRNLLVAALCSACSLWWTWFCGVRAALQLFLLLPLLLFLPSGLEYLFRSPLLEHTLDSERGYELTFNWQMWFTVIRLIWWALWEAWNTNWDCEKKLLISGYCKSLKMIIFQT